MQFPEHVQIREVGLRDGLQSQPEVIPTDTKVAMLERLVAAGCKRINAVSFVHPGRMPQMADAEELLERVGPIDGVCLSGLAPNRRGLDRAVSSARRGLLQEVLLITAATSKVLEVNGFEGDLGRARESVLKFAFEAKEAGLRTVVFISATFGCSLEGYVPPEVPLEAATEFYDSGVVDEVCFSDSTGQASPKQVHSFFSEVGARFPGRSVTAHYHDSRGAGLANVLATLDTGIPQLTIDAAFGGIGGDVPFLAEAAGNVCTEDLVCLLDGCGVETGIELDVIVEIARNLRELLGAPLPSHVVEVGPVRWRLAA